MRKGAEVQQARWVQGCMSQGRKRRKRRKRCGSEAEVWRLAEHTRPHDGMCGEEQRHEAEAA